LGINFLQKFRLHLDPKTKEITFQSAPSKALFATKNFTLPPFATTLVQARTFQAIDNKLHYIADIGAPKQPLISGLSTLVNFDYRNQCTLQIQNCAPHEVSIQTRDILGILSTEEDAPIPFNDESLATICEQSYQRLQKVKKRAWTRKEIEKDATLELQNLIAAGISTSWSNTKRPSAWTNMTWDWPRTSQTEFTSKIISPFSGSNSTYPKPTHSSSN
jgi:hypothetical protein